MNIHELEISNYKTLDNINMPLIFNDLNIFIGENDAGKTSLIDAIALLFHGGMSKSMFYDINKDLIIKAKLKNIHTGVMVDAIEILKRQYFYNGTKTYHFLQSLDLLNTLAYHDLNITCRQLTKHRSPHQNPLLELLQCRKARFRFVGLDRLYFPCELF